MMRTHLAGTGEQQNTQLAASVAGTAISIGASVGLVPLAAAGPIGAAIAGVALLVTFLFGTSKEGKQKIAATQVVNQAEDIFKKNIAAWNAEAHNMVNQAAALKNFDDVWSQVVNACTGPNADLASAGQRCVSERQRGGKYDYFVWYRDPIANAFIIDDPKNLPPVVSADPLAQTTGQANAAIATVAASAGLTEPQLLLIAATLLVVIAL